MNTLHGKLSRFYIAHKSEWILLGCFLLAGCAVFFTGMSIFTGTRQKQNAPARQKLLYQADTPVQQKPLTRYLQNLEAPQPEADYPEGISRELMQAYAQNADTAGYLRIPGTNIDTVIVRGKDNAYYLKNDFYKAFTLYGTPFLDYRCDPMQQPKNTILYGHTTTSGLQAFAQLQRYADPDFFAQHPLIEFGNLQTFGKWKIFSVFLTTASKEQDDGYLFYYIHPFLPIQDMPGYLQQVAARSLYETGVDYQINERILTLSTCTHDLDPSYDMRLVILARPLRTKEGEGVDAARIQLRPNYRRPASWYKKQGIPNPYADTDRWYPSV